MPIFAERFGPRQELGCQPSNKIVRIASQRRGTCEVPTRGGAAVGAAMKAISIKPCIHVILRSEPQNARCMPSTSRQLAATKFDGNFPPAALRQ